MSSIVTAFIAWNVIGHVILRPTEECPPICRCDDSLSGAIASCKINSFNDYPLHGYKIPELTVVTCKSMEMDQFIVSRSYQFVSNIQCQELIINTNNQNEVHENCKQYSKNWLMPDQNNIKVCTSNGKECVNFKCSGEIRGRRAVVSDTYTQGPSTTPKGNQTSDMADRKRSERVAMVMIGVISVAALLVNLVIMIKLCIRKRTVIDLFAISLMLFNVMLSFYGIGMIIYLLYENLRTSAYFCQFFTSIKLFSLGSSVYAVLLLIFHRSIENSIDIPGSPKEIHRHKIFKSIAWVLQCITIAGLFCVLSWIKLENWGYLCIIISPRGTVERILTFIEVMYYTFAGLAVVWYLMELIYPRCKIFLKKQINILQAMFADDKRKEELLTPYLIREEAYIARDFPVFFIVFITFTIWIGGYAITLPEHRWFDHNTAAAVRVCVVISPVILQPFLYLTMSKYSGRRVASKKEKDSRLSDVQTECKECTLFYTCPKCDKDAANESNMELVKMQQRVNKPAAKDDGTLDQSGKEIDLANNGNPVSKNRLPVSNDDEHDENKQLLSQEEKRKKLIKAPKIDISYPSPPPYDGDGESFGRNEEFGQLITS